MRESLLIVTILPLISEDAKNSQIVKVLKANHLTENSRNSDKQNFQGEILENLGISDHKVVPFLRKFNIIGKKCSIPCVRGISEFSVEGDSYYQLLATALKLEFTKIFMSNVFETLGHVVYGCYNRISR